MAEYAVKSEVAGVVWRVAAKPGDRIAEGDEVIILESMKMELPVLAGANGVLSAIHVKEGDSVAEGQVVATLSLTGLAVR
ncbi:MAG TPA: biotin/lipoyl-binding carrier protein [Stellaceae bacterium]|nr:biotin/lipoyl-binding carrier protein [Stellaceae bacterium]